MRAEHIFELWTDREFKRQILEYIDEHRYSKPEYRSELYALVWAGLGKTLPGKTTAHYLHVARCIVHRECLRLYFDG
jgi:hypothetical protein